MTAETPQQRAAADDAGKQKNLPAFNAVFSDEIDQTDDGETHGQIQKPGIPFPFMKENHQPIRARIESYERLSDFASSKTNPKEVLEIILKHEDIALWDFQPGDTIAVLPRNTSDEVNYLIEALDLSGKADCKVSLTQRKPSSHIPKSTTPRILLRDCLNLRSIPKKQFLRALANCCTEEEDIKLLSLLSSKEGSKAYNDLFLQKRTWLCDLLKMCSSCKPTLELLLEHLPRLIPRPYSIANSPLSDDQETAIKIIFSIMKDHPGVTTNFMRSLATEDGDKSIYLYPRTTNAFRFTSLELEKNQILICIGTALAPFLGFLEHKQHLMNRNAKNVGQTWLFYGSKTIDTVLKRENLLKWKEDGILNRYYESLSCDSNTPCSHVQDEIKTNAMEFIEFLLRPETNLYVCADGSQISKSIEECVKFCLMEELKISDQEVKDLLKNMRSNGKYIEDLWT